MKYLCLDCPTDLRTDEEAHEHAKSHDHQISGQVTAAVPLALVPLTYTEGALIITEQLEIV
jgi:hypothetical protein